MSSSSRKRKRGLSDANESGSLSIELSSLSDTQVGPVLGVCLVIFKPASQSPLICLPCCHTASFPCLIPPKSTTFNIFVGEQDEGKEFVKRASTISGDTNTIEFSGSVNDAGDGTGSKCDHLLVPAEYRTQVSLAQIFPRAPSTRVIETHFAARSVVPDFSTYQKSKELQAYRTRKLREF